MNGLLALAFVVLTPLPDPVGAGWKGAHVCEILHDDLAMRVLRCTFPPGTGHERHFHARHFGYALSGGRVRITDRKGVRDVELKTGSSFASDGIEWHEIVNIGPTTVQYLIVEPRAGSTAQPDHGDAERKRDDARQ
jgi:hypothetical protein